MGRQLDTTYLGSMQTYGRLQYIFFYYRLYLRIISMAVLLEKNVWTHELEESYVILLQ